MDGRAHQRKGVVVAPGRDVQRGELLACLVGGQLRVQWDGHVNGPLEEPQRFVGVDMAERSAQRHARVGDGARIAVEVGEAGDVADAIQMGGPHLGR